MKRKKSSGFTLVELLASVVIVGVLGTTAVVSANRSINNSHEDYCSNNSDMMIIAGKDYFNDNKTSLPIEIGEETCVSLKTLVDNSYIDKMYDYDNNLCDEERSKVCSIKQTNTKYYYRKEFNCGLCNSIDSTTHGNESNIGITITPNNASNSNNKDINVKSTIDGNGVKIISYKYEIYEKTPSGDIKVGGIEYKENATDTVDINIKLENKGTYYIVVTAINEYGKKVTKKSGDYTLNYTITQNCVGQIDVSAKVIESTTLGSSQTINNITEKKWYNGTLVVSVKKKGEIYSYDVYVKKSEDREYIKVIDKATKNQTIPYDKSRIIDNKYYQREYTNVTIETNNGSIGRTDKYKIKVVGYNENGQSCTTREYEYFQDNTDPTCTTTSTVPDSRWVNYDVTLTGTCYDIEREPGRVNSACKGNTNNKVQIAYDSYTNNNYSPGTIYDIAGNNFKCPAYRVRIDKIKPSISNINAKAGIHTATATFSVFDAHSGARSAVCYYGTSPGSYTSTASGSLSTCNFSGLRAGTWYYFKVVAYDNAGNSSEKTGSFKTLDCWSGTIYFNRMAHAANQIIFYFPYRICPEQTITLTKLSGNDSAVDASIVPARPWNGQNWLEHDNWQAFGSSTIAWSGLSLEANSFVKVCAAGAHQTLNPYGNDRYYNLRLTVSEP